MNKFPTPSFIHVDGWEIHISSHAESLAVPRDCPVETRKKARNYIRGLKKLWAASKEKGFFESAGEQVHGNTNTQQTKYEKLCKASSQEMIVNIGDGYQFNIESYVDGSYSVGVVMESRMHRL